MWGLFFLNCYVCCFMTDFSLHLFLSFTRCLSHSQRHTHTHNLSLSHSPLLTHPAHTHTLTHAHSLTPSGQASWVRAKQCRVEYWNSRETKRNIKTQTTTRASEYNVLVLIFYIILCILIYIIDKIWTRQYKMYIIFYVILCHIFLFYISFYIY